MVLEGLINPLKAEKKPWKLFFIGFIYASIALLLALWIFETHASLVMVFLTVLVCVPLVYGMFKLEEKKDIELPTEYKILKEHAKALSFLVFLFLGICVAYSVWYTFLPSEITNSAFSVQQQTITNINQQITGNILNQTTSYSTQISTEAISRSSLFLKIFLNNMKVLSFCILFSFIYGFGAIFILTWNASVIGAAIGNFIRSNLSYIADSVGFAKVAGYFQIFSLGLLRYSIHGIPEIIAYFTAGLAGGIISIAIVNHDFRTRNFQKVITDSADLILISVGVLLIAAILEVFVTPVLF